MTPQRSSLAWVFGVVLLIAACTPGQLAAQFVEPPPPAAYALQDVTVVQADGSRVSGVNIIVRDGMIEAMGADVPIPGDAQILEGDSLLIYPGLIDAQGGAEYEFPAPDVERSQVKSWAPPRSVQSFMPHRRVVDHLTATGEDLDAQRKQGVIAAAVHADGRLMPGRGAVLLHRMDAETPRELVLTPELGPVMSFRGAQGVYPSQVFTVMAFIRQSFEDASREGVVIEEFNRAPQGIPTPTWDPDYAVLREALDGIQPVYFVANSAEDIRNVLTLASEYDFRPIIVGGGEAWKVADRLKENGIPVLVSLDFPDPTRWDPEEEPVEPAEVREKEELENLYANAGRLAAAGVTIALTSGGGEADILEGAKKAIEYGLDEETALAAVTTTPAGMIGFPHLTMVEQGMPANFVVTSGELFGEETSIAYTFVEGMLEKGRVQREAGSGEAPAVNMAGTWEVTIDGEMTATMTLTQEEGGELSGVFSLGEMGSGDISGTISGNDVLLTIRIEVQGQSMSVEITGTVEGDSASGDGSSDMGDFSWTAKRTGEPGEEARK
ncbi:MAG: hypothetical protein JSW51_11510 [Gemmatimonadota bacterium]|nr:MAG: hypothetical protein JSW51_11510 [Gemmatimonadota bacterium]